jgi:tRNA/tmRNA/rRNA uracil-C5-methylase (TrmA/RlmC/RlmD family)
MGVIQSKQFPDALTPVCSECVAVESVDISHEEYEADKKFYDDHLCKTCKKAKQAREQPQPETQRTFKDILSRYWKMHTLKVVEDVIKRVDFGYGNRMQISVDYCEGYYYPAATLMHKYHVVSIHECRIPDSTHKYTNKDEAIGAAKEILLVMYDKAMQDETSLVLEHMYNLLEGHTYVAYDFFLFTHILNNYGT